MTDASPAAASGPHAARYNELTMFRNIYLQRARDAARLTLPYVIPPYDNSNSGIIYPTPWQAVGARGTNNLASKLLLTLFPPNASFLRMLVMDDKQIAQAMAQDPSFKSELEAALGRYEDEVQKFIEGSGSRPSLFEAFKQLIIAGNTLLHCATDEHKHFKVRVFRLDHYVVKRAPNGKVLDIVAKESTSVLALPAHVQLECQLINADQDAGGKPHWETVDIYTRIKRVDGDKFEVSQEINGIKVPDSDGIYPAKKCPWIALRWAKMDSEDYGRGFIEEYIGDLRSLDAMSQVMVEAAAIMGKMVPLVKPGGQLKIKDLTSKSNGEPIIGDHDDVKFLQVEKFPDLKFVVEVSGRIEQRLEQCFLLANSIQRQAERVTAEEIRIMAAELEDSMGGLYSLLSQELQLPFANIVIAEMEKEGKLPKLPKDISQPAIITGMEALGRGQDFQKLSTFIQGAAQDLGPGVVQQYVNIGEYFRRKATALAMDPTGLIKSDDEVQQAQQQAQQTALQHQVVPKAVEAIGKHKTAVATQAMKNQHEQSMAQQPQGA